MDIVIVSEFSESFAKDDNDRFLAMLLDCDLRDVLLGTSKSKGWLQTPALDMYGNDGHVTVKVRAKSSGSDTSAPLKISCGDADTLIYVNNEDGEYCVMLPCPANNTPMVKLSTAVGKRVVISSFQAYAGDDYTPIDLSKATSIETLRQVEGLKGQAVYNMRGQYVGNSVVGLPKGVYIAGQKKVIIK